ncbi:hypothetical protein JCM10207_007867 [Rhodosporidiobolus poonsookiae]
MAARPHPLLDRLEATRSPPSLRSTCEMILRLHWPAVTDVGDVQHDLIASLLPLCTASQLAQLEENSPHLSPYTNALWKDLCVADFVEVRKVVEDGRLPKDQEPESWRVRYGEEEQKREHKMRAILSKMRGQYSDYNLGRGTVQEIDGARQEKRRKTLQVTAARPKTLFEKAKSHTRAITSIYAPKRRPVPPAPAPPTSLGGITPAETYERLGASYSGSPPCSVAFSSIHPPLKGVLLLGAASGVAGSAIYYQAFGSALELDAEPGKPFDLGARDQAGAGVHLWGRNTTSSTSSPIKRPVEPSPLSNLVLRDLALSATYGCAIDSQGDVLQWGHGYGGPERGFERTVAGKDLVQIAPTEEGKVYGLSRKGEVFVWASDKLRQAAGGVAQQETRDEYGWGWKLLGAGLLWGGKTTGPPVEVLKLTPNAVLSKGEKFISISSGASHLLALTSSGRAFALPLSLAANEHGQLGVRTVTLLSPPHPGSSPTSGLTVRLDPDERSNEVARDPPTKRIDPLLLPSVSAPTTFNPMPQGELVPALPANYSATGTQLQLHPSPAEHKVLERSIQFCTTLHEIPSLSGVQVAELVAGKHHSLARLGGRMEGRVLGFGSNIFGQLGLGPTLCQSSIPAPTEIPLSASTAFSASGSKRPLSIACERIAAGGNVSYFVVSADRGASYGSGSVSTSQDLLACGQGQFGGIGNGLWAHAMTPTRVKAVSGLSEWSEKAGRIEPIKIKDVKAGNGHVAVILDNAVALPSGATYGRDVLVWGQNDHYQLGTGKRSNLPTPQHLAALPSKAGDKAAQQVEQASERLQLASVLPVSPTILAANPGLSRKSRVEQTIVTGDAGTGVYWRVVNP